MFTSRDRPPDHGTSAGTILGAILFLDYVLDTPACIQYNFAGVSLNTDRTTAERPHTLDDRSMGVNGR